MAYRDANGNEWTRDFIRGRATCPTSNGADLAKWETHFIVSQRQPQECTAPAMTFGGRCLNCGGTYRSEVGL